MKGDGAQTAAGGRGDLTSSKGTLLCPSLVGDTPFSLGVTQWAGWFLSGGGYRDQLGLSQGSCPGIHGSDAAGLGAASQPLLGAMDSTRGIRDAEHRTEHWKTISETSLWGESGRQAMGSSCPQLPSPCVAPLLPSGHVSFLLPQAAPAAPPAVIWCWGVSPFWVLAAPEMKSP